MTMGVVIDHKQLGDVEDVLGSMLQDYHLAKQVKIPEAPPPMSASLKTSNPPLFFFPLPSFLTTS